jgi:hypothetical protein
MAVKDGPGQTKVAIASKGAAKMNQLNFISLRFNA